MNFCPQCGAKILQEEAQFCANCGQKLPMGTTQQEAAQAPPRADGTLDTTQHTPSFSKVPAGENGPDRSAPLSVAPDLPEKPKGKGSKAIPFTPPPSDSTFSGAVAKEQGDDQDVSPFTKAVQRNEIEILFNTAPEEKPVKRSSEEELESLLEATLNKQPPPTAPAKPAAVPPQPVPPPQQVQEPASIQELFEQGQAQPEAAPGQNLFEQESRPQDPQKAAMVAHIAQAAQVAQSTQPIDTSSILEQEQPTPLADPARGAPRVSPPPRKKQGGRPPAESRRARRAAAAEEDHDRPRRSKGKIVATVIVVIFFFLLALAATTLIMLYVRNRPAVTIEAFATALSEKDTAALQEMSVLNNVTATEAGWQALCAAFEEEEKLNDLKAELARLSATPNALDYQAVRLQEEDFLLFIKKYQVRITGVSLLAPGAPEGTLLYLNDTEHTGAADTEGMVYSNIMPGHYRCRVTVPGQSGAEEIEVDAFSTESPTRVEGAAPATSAISIANCLSDDAAVFVNGVQVPDAPVDGVIMLRDVPVGATIRIEAEQEGQTQVSSVVFDNPSVTALRFEEYTAKTGEEEDDSQPVSEAAAFAAQATPDEINAVLETFYRSYLECVNAQSLDGIQLSTTNNNSNLTARIASPANQQNTYSYVSAFCDINTIKPGDQNGTPSLDFSGTFTFNYTPREGEGEPGESSNYQNVQLLYIDGQWLVNSFS